MKKLIFSIFAVALIAVSASAQTNPRGTSRDFWFRPVTVNTSQIKPNPTVAGTVITSDTNANGDIRYTGKAIATVLREAVAYSEYIATLTQSGTDAPVDSVLFNNLGGTVVWTRSSQGTYTGTLSGAFTPSRTIVTVMFGGSSVDGLIIDKAYCNNANTVIFSCIDNANAAADMDTDFPVSVSIRVYD